MKRKNRDAILLGGHLEKLRKKISGYENRSNLARELNVSSQRISNYENGFNFPSIKILIVLYKKLNISFEELLKPLLHLPETSTQTASLIHRLKNVCKNDRNIDKISGFLSSLEQEVEGGEAQRKIPNAKREDGRANSMGSAKE